MLASEPGQHAIMADDDYLDDIAAGFARVIDAKSPYTSGHSDRVALFADLIAEEMGIDTEARRLLNGRPSCRISASLGSATASSINPISLATMSGCR